MHNLLIKMINFFSFTEYDIKICIILKFCPYFTPKKFSHLFYIIYYLFFTFLFFLQR